MASSCMHVHLNAIPSIDVKRCRRALPGNRSRFTVAACSDAGATRKVSAKTSAVPPSPRESVGMTRRSGNFPPSAWDYGAILTSPNDVSRVERNNDEFEQLKNEIKRLMKVKMTIFEKLELVDSLQQFGIGYHFEMEIQDVLESIYIEGMKVSSNDLDLHSTSLLFKVLREHGYEVSQDVFKKFLCPKGGFTCLSEDHKEDIKGILSLYEASFLGFEGEDILHMARYFATKHLRYHLKSQKMEQKLEEQVKHVLDIPTYWRSMRVQARWSIQFNGGSITINPVVRQFAILDYNLIQELHKKEIIEVTKWWQNMSLRDELNFARDRIVESYIWTIGVISEPKNRDARKYITQAISILTIIDDIYDVYGSVDELEIFTEAIVRWDVNAIENLPKYMRICFLALFNMVNESSYHILKEKDIVVSPYIKKLWENLCKAYLVEAKWYHKRHTPLFEEYTRNGIASSGVPLVLSYAYIFASPKVSKEVLNFLQMSPNLINLSGKIFRLNNDINTSIIELKRGDVVKAIECYKHEHNTSESEARLHVKGIVMETWKRINKERFSTPIQKDIVDWCINICRTSHSFYQNSDGYGSPSKDQVIDLLFENI